MKNIVILGSTGSIGTQALDVIQNDSENFRVLALVAGSNIDLLEEQVKKYCPKIVAISDKSKYTEFKKRVGNIVDIEVGNEAIDDIAKMNEADIVLSSIVGVAGLSPTYAAIQSGKTIALANKESMVTAGRLLIDAAAKSNATIIPVDSEHSAIYQCISNNDTKAISRLILTASGGPFRKISKEQLEKVSVVQALKHPNWSMGKKISIDSATMMNKGLEVIEARWLFDIDYARIDVCVHPQSIIHSMVEYVDGSIIAQMGAPDMRLPIQFALTYPHRKISPCKKLDLFSIQKLEFEPPCFERFPCLGIAYDALKMGDSACIVLNASNEVVVDLFIREKIRFFDIPKIVEKTINSHTIVSINSINEVIELDKWARMRTIEIYKKGCSI